MEVIPDLNIDKPILDKISLNNNIDSKGQLAGEPSSNGDKELEMYNDNHGSIGKGKHFVFIFCGN